MCYGLSLLQMSQKKAAQKRWDILAKVIKSKDCHTDVTGSKRSFQSYNIVKLEPLEDETEAGEAEWRTVRPWGSAILMSHAGHLI